MDVLLLHHTEETAAPRSIPAVVLDPVK